MPAISNDDERGITQPEYPYTKEELAWKKRETYLQGLKEMGLHVKGYNAAPPILWDPKTYSQTDLSIGPGTVALDGRGRLGVISCPEVLKQEDEFGIPDIGTWVGVFVGEDKPSHDDVKHGRRTWTWKSSCPLVLDPALAQQVLTDLKPIVAAKNGEEKVVKAFLYDSDKWEAEKRIADAQEETAKKKKELTGILKLLPNPDLMTTALKDCTSVNEVKSALAADIPDAFAELLLDEFGVSSIEPDFKTFPVSCSVAKDLHLIESCDPPEPIRINKPEKAFNHCEFSGDLGDLTAGAIETAAYYARKKAEEAGQEGK